MVEYYGETSNTGELQSGRLNRKRRIYIRSSSLSIILL